jgi:type II secretory pathway component PulF
MALLIMLIVVIPTQRRVFDDASLSLPNLTMFVFDVSASRRGSRITGSSQFHFCCLSSLSPRP